MALRPCWLQIMYCVFCEAAADIVLLASSLYMVLLLPCFDVDRVSPLYWLNTYTGPLGRNRSFHGIFYKIRQNSSEHWLSWTKSWISSCILYRFSNMCICACTHTQGDWNGPILGCCYQLVHSRAQSCRTTVKGYDITIHIMLHSGHLYTPNFIIPFPLQNGVAIHQSQQVLQSWRHNGLKYAGHDSWISANDLHS